MKTHKNLLLIISLAVTIPVATYSLLSIPMLAFDAGKKSQTKEIKVDTNPENRNKYQTIALQPTCPRVIAGATDVSLESIKEHDHCPSCNMGVFFARGQDKISCSCCELEKTL